MKHRWTMTLALALALPAAAGAQDGRVEGFFIEVPVGLATPIAEGEWELSADASFVTGVQLGYLIGLGGWSAGIGPEVGFTYLFANVEDKDWHGGRDDDVYIGRLMLIGGARFVVAFGSAMLYARMGVGLDYAHASWDEHVGRLGEDKDDSDAGVGMLVGAGMGYMLADWIALSAQFDFPVGFHDHDARRLPVNLDGDKIDILASVAATFYL